MQAVILAAGKGTRLHPLTISTPKPLIAVGEKPLIEHVLDALPSAIDELIVIVNHLREQIIEQLGDAWNGIPIRYLVQEPLNGTAGALWLAQEHLHDKFLVINADDLYTQDDLEQLIKHEWSMLVHEVDRSLTFAALSNLDDCFIQLGPGSTAVCGAYVLGTTLFEQDPVQIYVGDHTELGLPQTLERISRKVQIQMVQATHWHQVGTHNQLEAARALTA
ncbi:NTP transferase domain-containing protein [Candidatus Uhrbacteria bacterium]|jgi:UDP-N-acetylglucosamine diphosphorylase / glucose-1-phosphate thymidylyltransferase / UDP-N-acetylgalactosamine diphosphorylase / glucosamine-1-phosphate N-acetyltransferase / galactosamine-1-phosphate N-acetyltransferase|nr:NTP transferase domain-containing protein [Candidatus Uhrbacteria bacterium]